MGQAKAATQQSIEIATPFGSEDLLGKFATLSGLNANGISIMESVLACLQRYFDTVTSDPWVLPLEVSKPAQQTSLYISILASLRKILQPLSKVPQLAVPVEKICGLVVAQSSLKLTKQGH